MKRKNKKFYDQKRLRADSRMLSKGINTLYQGRTGINPTERYGVSEGQVALKRSLRTQLRVKISATKEILRTTKNPVEIVKTFLKTKSEGQYKTGPLIEEGFEKGDSGKITITKKRKKYYKNINHYRPVLTHELVHSIHLPSNDASANAFESYLIKSLKKSKRKLDSRQIANRSFKLEKISKKLYEQNAKKYEKIDNVSLSDVGNSFGKIAFKIENQTRKPGAELFFLKKILNGKITN